MELKNRWVNFQVKDVFIPDPEALLMELYGSDILQGWVLDMSDDGLRHGRYAVVRLEGVEQPILVPVERILGVL